jgi:penicillin V acylase-like amidase (Ntn superfamily)
MSLIGLWLAPFKEVIARRVQWQQEVLSVMAVLPRRYSAKQVEAALTASSMSPSDIYMCLASGQHTIGLERFYEALGVNI